MLCSFSGHDLPALSAVTPPVADPGEGLIIRPSRLKIRKANAVLAIASPIGRDQRTSWLLHVALVNDKVYKVTLGDVSRVLLLAKEVMDLVEETNIGT